MSRGNRGLIIVVLLVGIVLGAAGVVLVSRPPGVTPTEAQDIPTAAPTPTALPDAVFSELDARDQVMINLYDRINPSVVHIASRQNVPSFFYGTVPQEGTGSGFLWDDQGHIVTNNHVVSGADQLDVLFASGLSLPATVVGTDPYYDLAVVKVELPANTASPLQLGDSGGLKVGQSVIAIGNPFGLDRTLTTGVISALGRRIETDAGTAIGQAIQTDAAINPGNSGGPLLDIRGQVVGINTAINSPSGGSVGIGFAVPVNIIKQVVPSLISDGHYTHPSLGVQVAELGTEVSTSDNSVQRGLLIVQMSTGSAAEQAGLQAATITTRRGRYVVTGGDIITAVGGQAVETRNDLLLALEEHYRPGDQVEITFVRDGQPQTQTVTLGAE
ncbi:MAG: trypsin-like peptidase domain-containing protein [Anaerolineae bacterium]|nr:trypsin-like peptidase domain-containing protein [Anaerolineae bacterium]